MSNEKLIESLRAGKLILFVGSGVSQHLKLPSWEGLADHVAGQLGFDPAIFKAHGEFLQLFEYYRLKKGTLRPLRSWMDTHWHSSDISIASSEVHRLIVEIGFPKIYTTNFDSWIERAHDHLGKPYQKITNARSLATATRGIPQIVKLHGDFDDDASLVLTESNYFERLSFESPLDVQLRADLLSHSFLYIGYSLRDINIRLLLYKLQKQAAEAGLPNSAAASFIFLSRPNIVHETILSERRITPIVSDFDDSSEGLNSFLRDLLEHSRSE